MSDLRTAIIDAIIILGESQGSTHQAMWKIVKRRAAPEPRYADFMLALKKLSDAKEFVVKDKGGRYRMPNDSKKRLIAVYSKGRPMDKKKMDTKKKTARKAAASRKKAAIATRKKAGAKALKSQTKKKSEGKIKKETKKKTMRKKAAKTKAKNSRSLAPAKAKAAAAKSKAEKTQGKPGVSSKRRSTRAAVKAAALVKEGVDLHVEPPNPEKAAPIKAVLPKNLKSKGIKKKPATKKKPVTNKNTRVNTGKQPATLKATDVNKRMNLKKVD